MGCLDETVNLMFIRVPRGKREREGQSALEIRQGSAAAKRFEPSVPKPRKLRSIQRAKPENAKNGSHMCRRVRESRAHCSLGMWPFLGQSWDSLGFRGLEVVSCQPTPPPDP